MGTQDTQDTQYTHTQDSQDPDEASEESSGAEQGTEAEQPKKRRRRATNVILPDDIERDLGEWLHYEVPFMYDKGDPCHKNKDLIESCWNTKGASLDPPVSGANLKMWFNSQRSRYGRLIKDKSGDGAKRLTEREKWIIATFSFLKPHIRRQHTPRSMGLRRMVSVNVSFIHVAVVHGCQTRFKVKVACEICTVFDIKMFKAKVDLSAK